MGEKEKKIEFDEIPGMKSIPVDIRHLEDAFHIDLSQFEAGKTYPLSKLLDALGLLKGRHNIPPGVVR
jgi:hypothetical protein